VARLPDLQAAYTAQQAALVAWLAALPATGGEQPSRLAGWTVQQLAFHTTEVPRALTASLAKDPPKERAQSIASYTANWRAAAEQIAGRDRAGSAGVGIAEIISRHEVGGAAMIAALGSVDPDQVVAARRGPIRVSDLLITRINELVVHSIDLSASVPDIEAVVLDPRALGISCRMLTAILAERVPGRTVEVRVPPYAAVQCVDGPRHTRGTPANVVEASPVTWVELATGRRSWADALGAGQLQVSGERADISEHLPVLS
jgi:uncharacterized protein (TIGR03083 family)